MIFWYRTRVGRFLLKKILKSKVDLLIVKFLSSPLSKPLIPLYIKKHRIPLEEFREQLF